jgi:hypothetical protein
MPVETIPLPLGGLDDRDALLLQDGVSPDCQNVRFHLQRVTQRPGFSAWELYSQLPQAVVVHDLHQGYFLTPLADGSPSQFLDITETSIRTWNPATRGWTTHTLNPPATLNPYQHFSIANTLGVVYWTALGVQIRQWDGVTAALMASDLDGIILSVASTPPTAGTGYTAGDVLTLATGAGGTVTVTSVGGGGVVLAVTLTTAGTGYAIGEYATTGGTGIGATVQVTSANLPISAMALLAFDNRIIAIHTTEGGVIKPSRVRWPANGNMAKWAATTDGAGYLDCIETSSAPLTGGFVLNGRCYLTKAHEIIELRKTGNAQAPFAAGADEIRVQGTGMMATNSWAAADYFGFFVGSDNVHQWDGASLRPVGDPIREILFTGLDYTNVSSQQLQALQGCVNPERHEYWLIGGQTVAFPAHHALVYNWVEQRWYRHVLPNFPTGLQSNLGEEGVAAFYSIAQFHTSDFNPSNYGALPIAGLPTQDTLIFSNGINSYVFDETLTEDSFHDLSTAAIDAYVTTKDYNAREISRGQVQPTIGKMNVLHMVKFQGAVGAEVEVGMSTDRGLSWITTFARVNESGVGTAFFIQPYATVRFRFRSTATGGFDLHGQISYLWRSAGFNLTA